MSSSIPGIPPGNIQHRTQPSINNSPWAAAAAQVSTGGRGGGPNNHSRPCRFFMSGHCRNGTRCNFSHTSTKAQESTENRSTNFPGISNDQFSKVQTNLTPGQTFNSLRDYVEDTFEFQTPDQVYRFLSILCNANSQNSLWTAKDGQLHLHQLVNGNGILRLADAIHYPQRTNRFCSFQRGYVPIFTYMASDWVVKSTLHSDVNALYGLVHSNFQTIRNNTEINMRKLMAARNFGDRSQPLSGKQIFKVIFVTLFEYLTRFKDAPIVNPGVREFAEQIAVWFDEWLLGLVSSPSFQDECATYGKEEREFIIENLRRDKDRVLRLVKRGQTIAVNTGAQMSYSLLNDAAPGLVAALERNYEFDGPGEFCETGPRHDNDHVEIELIRVPPTRDELLCGTEPYLPANFFEAPHFYDPRSIERLLDIQFRLLREELTSPVRLAVQLVIEDLKKSESESTNLAKIIIARGGRYAAPATARESIIFSVFTGITFQPLQLNNRGISVGIGFDTPPGRARRDTPEERGEYWEQVSKKRLMQDGLVALIWKDHTGKVDIYVGTVASSGRDLVNCSKGPTGQDRVSIRVSFFDAKANVRIVQALQSRRGSNDTRLLIEAPVFYEGIRPFLEALKREPELLPFGQYLRLQSREELTRTNISPPLYSRTPGFYYELKDLFPPEAEVDSLRLITRDPDSVANARAQLIHSSRLDPSQAEAVVDSLTRELAMIQGPPGTGKSYTGLEIIRVLIQNNISPILLVAFTNHALDHMLNGILDAGITDKIVRLGSQSSIDERLSKYTLDNIERDEDESRLESSARSVYRDMKILQSYMEELMSDISSRKVPSKYIEQHISSAYPHHHGELFYHVPDWINAIVPKASDAEEGWERVGKSANQDQGQGQSIIDFWLEAGDLKFLETHRQSDAISKKALPTSGANLFSLLRDASSDDEDPTAKGQNFLEKFMRGHGLKDIPQIPKTNRHLDILLKNPKVWRMSRDERTNLHKAWSTEATGLTHSSQVQDFEEFRQAHEETASHHKEIMDQLKADILSRSHIVGCTTTGAAKLVSLLSGMSPKVMIVEEAGQVLEAHILASLVGTVEHVILIGDPLQLRPNINSYKLATENPKTGKIYRFDQSLMERLSSSGFPMSQIDVQRRMRPEISSLIRNTLYPNLKDNERVLNYPNVRGMHKDVFFVSHSHKEVGGGEDSVSKHNSFEIDMIYDLVLHLLRQGCYNKPGNIVILAAYLGQIPKLRKKLQEIVTIVIDERDAELLEQQTMDQDEAATVQKVQLSKQVIIRTVDNFQGEEAEIVILSLVRNGGTPFTDEALNLRYDKGKAPIGFLRSLNRTNVGLSRAKHGLYIFGNAPELSQGSKMWSDVLNELQSTECVGPKLPIACHRHPDYVQWIERPGELPIVSPNGGCHQPCGAVLSCGHICPSLCHADDPNHISTRCQLPCARLCSRSHPCDRKCWECSDIMGECRFSVIGLQLPCGHIHPPKPCYRLSVIIEDIKCPIPVVKTLPSCDHHATMLCHKDPTSYKCQERVSKKLLHCQHRAVLPCPIDPGSHLCQERVERLLDCGHHLHMLCHQDPTEFLCPTLVEKKLPCDHFATVPCHQDISEYVCRLEVEKPLPRCNHRAIMPCHQSPTRFTCQESVTKVLPACNHSAQMPCHKNVNTYICREPVDQRFADCDHQRRLLCHQLTSQSRAESLCQEQVEKEIPTCKHRAVIPCHMDPGRYKCRKNIEKALPFCEHRAVMPCHINSESYFCPKQCGNVLSCCAGKCTAKCGDCHRLNPGERGSGTRYSHTTHTCGRRMACGHGCKTVCNEDHTCSTLCKDKCHQSCSHSNCHQECSIPCKPCGMPCVWKCTHTQCTSLCGMACTRLPCDVRCPNMLSCGHPCPSVCGEPCEYQTCRTCSEDEILDSTVDLLEQVHLRDLVDDGTLNSMTITLSCRHVFTVEALDSVTRIRDFYKRDNLGRWTDPIMPDASDVRSRPVCPYCSGKIDSLRYGRVLKHSNHSILKHNVARSLSDRLSSAEEQLMQANDKIEREVIAVARSLGTANIPIPSENALRTSLERVNAALAADESRPTSFEIVQNLSKFYGFTPRHTKAWRRAISSVSTPYELAYGVTAHKSDPSLALYEDSLSRLHAEELIGNTAHIRIGHPYPRAGHRFTVEAFWVTIDILMTLGLAISKACKEVWERNTPGANTVTLDKIAEIILLQASKDAETAYRLADESKSLHKALLCRVLIFQTQYEHAAHKCQVAIRNGSLMNRETRDEYLDMCTRNTEQIRDYISRVPRDYYRAMPRGLMVGEINMKAEWVGVHFVDPSEIILEAWGELVQIIQDGGLARRQEQVPDGQLVIWNPIIQVAASSNRELHTERFYQCPLGHPYARGECMDLRGKIWCPECGVSVGGLN